MNLKSIFAGCGHCKSLAPVYEKVAETFKNEPNVSIGIINLNTAFYICF